VKLQYSVDGGSWRSVNGPTVSFASGLVATYVSLRVDLSTTDRYATPQVNRLLVTFDLVPASTTGAATTSTWSSLYTTQSATTLGQSTTAGSPTKSADAAGSLPQGSATPGVAQASVHSGFLMQQVADGAVVTKDKKGLRGLPVEAAGTTAALLLLTSVYSLGLASTTLSHATQGAMVALKSILMRSL
jgi:hypothetical protein